MGGVVTVDALKALPENFKPGDIVNLEMAFENTGAAPVNGIALIIIKNGEGKEVKRFDRPLSEFAPGIPSTRDTKKIPIIEILPR